MKALLRTAVLTFALVVASLSSGYAVSDTGTCYTYCYDQYGNQTGFYQTQIDLDGCCGNRDSLCGPYSHAHWSAKYYFSEVDCDYYGQ